MILINNSVFLLKFKKKHKNHFFGCRNLSIKKSRQNYAFKLFYSPRKKQQIIMFKSLLKVRKTSIIIIIA